MKREETSNPAQTVNKTGFALWQDGGSLSHIGGALPVLTAYWSSPERWWADIQSNITPPPLTQCPICNHGQRLGRIQAAITPPNSTVENESLLFEIEFAGHPHSWLKETRGDMVLVTDITRQEEETQSVIEDIQQYESICNFIEDVYYRIDLDGNIQFVSPSCMKLLQFRPEELLGKPMEELCASPEYMIELLSILKRTDTVSDFDMVLQCRQGRQVPISLTAQMVYDADQNQVGVEGIFRDITEREQLDTLLVERTRQFQESMARLEFHKQAIDQHHLVTVITPEGKISYVNRKMVEVSQFPKTELTGATLDILNSGFHPKSFYKEMWRTIRSGKTWHGEVKKRKKSGEFFWVDETITPFLTASGEPFQYISTATETTQQVLSIERLEQNRKFLNSIIDAIGDGLYVLGQQGQLLSLNKEGEQLLGWQESELLHTNFHEAVHHTRRDGSVFKTVDCTIHQSLLGRAFRKEEDYFIKKDGSFLPVSLVTTPLIDGQEIIGSVAIFRDNSQIEKRQTELESSRASAMESSRLKSEFLANRRTVRLRPDRKRVIHISLGPDQRYPGFFQDRSRQDRHRRDRFFPGYCCGRGSGTHGWTCRRKRAVSGHLYRPGHTGYHKG